MGNARFHGRHDGAGQVCAAPGCGEAGEFRAPGPRAAGFDGPGEYRWLCLDHVREFNAGYDWFAGMSADEIYAAQAPGAAWREGWATETRAFRGDGGVGDLPRWADFADPLEAIGARAAGIRSRTERAAKVAATGRFTAAESAALEVLGLSDASDLRALRQRYSELVRRYHPDRNGGDRRHEARLGRVVEAYQTLRKSAAFE